MKTYVRFWDQREGAESLALVRIAIGLVMLFDLLQIVQLDLVRALWAPIEDGGIGPNSSAAPTIAFYRWFGASATSAWLLVSASILFACTLSFGLYTRTSALLLLLCSAQLSGLGATDSGGDRLVRNVLCLLALSGAGATWSLDAKLDRRRQQQEIPAWPRYLLIAQMVIMYFFSGILKQTPEWSSMTGYAAVFRLLADPHLSRYAWSHEQLSTVYPLLQLATLATLVFERAAIALPLLLWLRTRGPLIMWVATGIFFHLALALTVKIGIFPWACLALYPALAKPAFWRSNFDHLRSLAVPPRAQC